MIEVRFAPDVRLPSETKAAIEGELEEVFAAICMLPRNGALRRSIEDSAMILRGAAWWCVYTADTQRKVVVVADGGTSEGAP